MGKIAGKTKYSGRRRTVTRKSGFVSHPNSTGGEYKAERVDLIRVGPDRPIHIEFSFPKVEEKIFAGFGGYFLGADELQVTIQNPNSEKSLLKRYQAPDWSKFGAIWLTEATPIDVGVVFESPSEGVLALHEISCGLIWHEFFDGARPAIMKGMHNISPEGNFYTQVGKVRWPGVEVASDAYELIHLKSCNRCARFLPINLHNERNALSFSNHCVARAPCSHKGFGRLTNIGVGEEVALYHGYQLECRFCKKYVVNAPLNPQRTTAQMKEDGQRRRHFELLIAELNQTSPQLAYRHQTGRELAEDVYERFGKKCFNCNSKLKTSQAMHLDHTRPLALLWPLDGSATALCAACNSQKRDRFPAEFYSHKQLVKLSEITGLRLQELKSPEPNLEVIGALFENIDWLYDSFLVREDLLRERDGKIASELVVKALDKVLARSKEDFGFSFADEYKRRKAKKRCGV